jgi:hypothetical protein
VSKARVESRACVEKRAAVNMLGPMPRRDKPGLQSTYSGVSQHTWAAAPKGQTRAAVNILGRQSTYLGRCPEGTNKGRMSTLSAGW